MTKLSITKIGEFISLREWRYESGLVEISAVLPAVLSGSNTLKLSSALASFFGLSGSAESTSFSTIANVAMP